MSCFDCHAHPGIPTENAYVCTASPLEGDAMENYPYFSIGMIPEGESEDFALLESYLKRGSGIGEIGIDKRYPNIEKQFQLFRRNLLLANEYHLVPTIHFVGHTDEVLKTLQETKTKRFLIHGYTGSLETAKAFLRQGGLLSLPPRLERAKSFEILIHNLPFFLTESDMKTGPEQEEALKAWNLLLSEKLGKEVGSDNKTLLFDYLKG